MSKKYKTAYEYIAKVKKKYGLKINVEVVDEGILIEIKGNENGINYPKISQKINKKLGIDAEAIGISKKDLVELFF